MKLFNFNSLHRCLGMIMKYKRSSSMVSSADIRIGVTVEAKYEDNQRGRLIDWIKANGMNVCRPVILIFMAIYSNMQTQDIAAGLSLCRAAGWNQLARDWEIFLHLSKNDCRLATIEDTIVGTVTTLRYQHFFSWIGMVLVHPANRGQGIGMQLLHEALHILRNEETIKLDATPAGREIYLKLNFVDEYELTRIKTVVSAERLINPTVLNSTARVMRENDVLRLPELDRKIFGADRLELLEWQFEGAPQYAFLVEEKNNLRGFCMGREGYHFTHIGPVIAQDTGVAKSLIAAALGNCIGRPVILDVLSFNKEWLEWLKALGFTEQRPLTRMYRGSNRFPGIPEKQFAILGPEFG